MLVAKLVVVWRLNPEGSVTTMADDLCEMDPLLIQYIPRHVPIYASKQNEANQ
jgi:hypothetical protein